MLFLITGKDRGAKDLELLNKYQLKTCIHLVSLYRSIFACSKEQATDTLAICLISAKWLNEL